MAGMDSSIAVTVDNENAQPSGSTVRAHATAAHGRPDAGLSVPCSNTGRKIRDEYTFQTDKTATASGATRLRSDGHELDGEWVEVLAKGKRPCLQRTPLPYEAGQSKAAIIDWLAFTVRPPKDQDVEWVIRQLRDLGVIGTVEALYGGYAGYACKAHYQEGKQRLCLIAWGGRSQASTVYVSFTGHGCARIKNWQAMRSWLEGHSATITRLDLAYDDLEGECVSIAQAVEWYQSGGFGAGGRMPSHQLHGDWLLGDQSKKGRTLEIGSREGGKLCRVYEKGKQLGDPDNPWVRVEVEWHNESRHIPHEALTIPGKYLAGAYDCLHFLDQEQCRIQTQQRAAQVSYGYAMYNGRRLVGKLVNLALEVNGGDYVEVVEQLRRDGYPARVEPYMHAIKDRLEVLADGAITPHLTRGERSA